MTETAAGDMDAPLAATVDAPRAGVRAERRTTVWVVAALAGLVGVSAALRFWGATRVPSPWFVPDEIVYGELGRSLYGAASLQILGGPTPFFSLVYPALVGLPLSVGDPERGYLVLKLLQAVVLSLTAIPVYLWTRSLASRRYALVAAALTLALPGLAYAGFVMSEVAFYPVVLLAAWTTARALERPTVGRQLVVLGAVALATLTRLQAIAFLPVLGLAVVLKTVLDRRGLRGLRPFVPAAAGLSVLAVAALAVKLARGGSATGSVLGAYRVTGSAAYTPGDVARFVAYHAADVVLLVALLPAVGAALLAVRTFAGRERSEGVRAYVAVAVALVAGFVAEVGTFASGLVGRLAERNLIGLAPVLFIGFACWLDRGAPRPRVATAVVSLAALALLAVVPWGRFAVERNEPDAFSMIPLRQLHSAYPDLDPRVVILLGAAELLALLVFVPRRFVWTLPAVAAALLIVGSALVTREVADQARIFRAATAGRDKAWIDGAARAPVAFVYSGELAWTGGAPAWVNLFWNDRIDRVYDLYGASALGPLPQERLRVAGDGRLVGGGGRTPSDGLVAASQRLRFVGEQVAASGSGHALWRVASPVRLSTRTEGLEFATGDIPARAAVTAYACAGGRLEVSLLSSYDQRVELRRNGVLDRRLGLRAGRVWSGDVAGLPRPDGSCLFGVVPEGRLHANRLEFVR